MAYFLSYYTDSRGTGASIDSYIVEYELVPGVLLLQNRCLVIIRNRIMDSESWERFLGYDVDMEQSAMKHIRNFMKISLAIQNLIGREGRMEVA
jgi:hypothetical protein